jgi:Flp pilus assembly protein TadB
MTYRFSTYRYKALRKTVFRLLATAFAIGVVLWGVVTLMATTTPTISVATGALVLGCGLTYLLIQRSRRAHDRAIGATYQSFGPALARRRAEGQSPA